MVKGLYTAYTGMLNEQKRMDVMTNNLANVNTVGFKKEGATSQTFSDVLTYKIKDNTEANLPRAIGYMEPGVKTGETYRDFSEGGFRTTNNSLDLALSGNGFFTIQFLNRAGETSQKYTRDGSFTMDREGYIVTKDGDFLLNTDGNRVQVDPNTPVSFNLDGTYYQNGEQVGQLQITNFQDYNYLEKYGENLFDAIEGAVQIPADARVNQGLLENSNVQAVQEMVNMIAIQRNYESNQKVVTTMDDTLDKSVNQVGRLV